MRKILDPTNEEFITQGVSVMKDEIKVLGAMILLILAGAATLMYSQTGDGTKLTSSQTAAPDDPPPPPNGLRRGPGPGRDILDRLDLTADQKQQIGALRSSA